VADEKHTPSQDETRPLGSEELERDVAAGGLRPDDRGDAAGETHLPASESDVIREAPRGRPNGLDDALTRLPPG